MSATRALSPSFGAEVLNFDPSASQSEASINAIRALWAEHKLLLFRNQQFDEAALVQFSKEFGALEIHVREEYWTVMRRGAALRHRVGVDASSSPRCGTCMPTAGSP